MIINPKLHINSFNAQLQKPSLMSFNISNCFPIELFWKDGGSKNLIDWQKLPYLKAMPDIFYFAGVPGCYCVPMYLHILLCVCPHRRLMLVSIRSRTFYLTALFIKHTTAAVCVCVCVCMCVCVCVCVCVCPAGPQLQPGFMEINNVYEAPSWDRCFRNAISIQFCHFPFFILCAPVCFIRKYPVASFLTISVLLFSVVLN